jgi:hypothetical protein
VTGLRELPPDPRHPGKHIDPATGIWPIAEWGAACYRGFVSDERFGPDGVPVIKRSNRKRSRAWRELRRPE